MATRLSPTAQTLTCLPAKFRASSWSGVVKRNAAVREAVKRLANGVSTDVIISGGIGNGKSLLAALALLDYVDVNGPHSAVFLTSAQYMTISRDAMNNAAAQRVQRRLMYRTDLLVLDDLGNEYRPAGSTFAQDSIGELLTYRDGAFTIVTTRKDGKELKKFYGERIDTLIDAPVKIDLAGVPRFGTV